MSTSVSFRGPPRQRRGKKRLLGILPAALLACVLVFAEGPSPALAQDRFSYWLGGVVDDVNTYWQGMFNSVGLDYFPADWVAFGGRPVMSSCGIASTKTGPFYCTTDFTVYLDESFIAGRYYNVGDFAAAIIVGHEIGHHVQNLLKITPATTIQKELNADCLAGMWAAYVGYQGRLDPGDIEAAIFGTMQAGDNLPWFAPGAHGTPAQRAHWLQKGYAAAVFSDCNTWL